MPATRSPFPSTLAARVTVWAGLAACAVGFALNRMWAALPQLRFGEMLLLASLSMLLAWPIATWARRGWPTALAIVWLAALAAMTGPMPLLAVALLALASAGIGGLLYGDESPSVAFVIGTALIAGVLGWTVTLPIHFIWVYVPALVALVVWRAAAIARNTSAAWGAWREATTESPRAACAAVIAIGLATCGAWLPTLQYDDLAYHLGLPWEWMLDGRYRPDVIRQVWALAPWGSDVLQGVAQVLARQEARGPLDTAWLLACAGLLWRLGAQLGMAATLRWLLLALFATIPQITALTAGMQTELPATAALLAFACVVGVGPGRRRLLACAVLLGFLFALKLLHPLEALGLCAVAMVVHRASFVRRPLDLLLAAGAVLAIGGSSYAFAWWRCGNPVLPLFNALFRSPCLAPVNFDDARWSGAGGPWTPWSMTFATHRHLEGWDGGLGFLLVALAGAAAVALFVRTTRWLTFAGIVAVAVAMITLPYARYVVPGLVLLLPAAVRAVELTVGGRGAAAILVALCTLDAAYVANANWLLHTGGPRRALLAMGRDAPLFDNYAPERSANAYLRRALRDAVVLDIGAATQAELGPRGRTTTWYAPSLNRAAGIADRDPTGAAWANILVSEHVGVVLIRDAEMTASRRAGLARLQAYPAMTFGPVECWRLPATNHR